MGGEEGGSEGGETGGGGGGGGEVNLEELKVRSASPPKTLHPAAADAYLMFQVG